MKENNKFAYTVVIFALIVAVGGLIYVVFEKTRYQCKAMESEIQYSLSDLDQSTDCKEVVDHINRFSIQMIQNMKTEENQFISPLSMYELMSMIYYGASGETKEQIREALAMPSEDKKIGEQLYVLNHQLKTQGGDNFHYANSLWIDRSLPLAEDIDPNFLAPIQNYLQSKVFYQDFKSDDMPKKLDQWAKDVSDGNIQELGLQPDPEDRFYLLNAVCFEDKWKAPFTKGESKEMPFYGTKGQSEVTMMTQKHRSFQCLSTDQVIGIQMPYQGDFVMDVYMSQDQNTTIQEICSKMSPEECVELFEKISKEGYEHDVKVFFPKMRLDYEFNAIPYLESLGITNAFSYASEFDHISKEEELFIAKTAQKTYLEIDEEGTRAVSISFGIGFSKSADMFDYFIVNRPFVFVIRNVSTNAILFYGNIQNL